MPFTGSARDQGEVIAWSLILKIIPVVPERDDPSHPMYWKREVLAYQTGLLDDLPGGLAAPRCFTVAEQPTGEFWLWLEEVRDDLGLEWPLEHYGTVARHLGQFNGAYLVGRSIPSEPWLSKGWLRRRVDRLGGIINQLPNILEHPLGRVHFRDGDGEAFAQLWNAREAIFGALDQLPQVLCHRDAFRRNLFARCKEDSGCETVAVDWAYTSPGGIGEELVSLILATHMFGGIDLSEARELDHIAYEGYLEGARDTDWEGDPRDVRLGFTAGSIRYAFTGLGLLAIMVSEDKERHASLEELFGCPLAEVADRFVQNARFTRELLGEAKKLMDDM